MTVRWAVGQQLTGVSALAATRVTDATPAASTPINLGSYPPGSRLVFVLQAFETNVANTGGTWTITESATSGGSYTAATVDEAPVATPASAGNDVQVVTVLPNAAKPFVKATFTGADANTEVDVSAVAIIVPRVV